MPYNSGGLMQNMTCMLLKVHCHKLYFIRLTAQPETSIRPIGRKKKMISSQPRIKFNAETPSVIA